MTKEEKGRKRHFQRPKAEKGLRKEEEDQEEKNEKVKESERREETTLTKNI